MKELSVEEKAKAYDEVLERAKSLVDFCSDNELKTLEYVFPELKESEDERIRKGIIRCIKGNMPDNDFRKKYIAWLEKTKDKEAKLIISDEGYNKAFQDGIEEVLINSHKYGLEAQDAKVSAIEGFETEFERQVSGLIASAINKEHEYNQGYVKWTANALLNYAKHELEKQGEQNDKIIKGKNYFCVKTHNYAGVEWIKGTKYYASDNYTLVNQGCEYYCPEYSKEEHNYLFKEVKCDGCVEKQGEQKPYGQRQECVDCQFNYAEECKGSCAMKKDEQKPKFRIGDIIKKKSTGDIVTISEIDLKNREYRLSNTGFIPFKYEHLWELVEQKPAWSEDDEKIYQSIIDDTVQENQLDGKQINWLKSLKDRVQPQSKQEWSEEDEKNLYLVSTAIASNYSGELFLDKKKVDEQVSTGRKLLDWLYSLSSKTTWKPSIAQLNALSIVSKGNAPDDIEAIVSLYNDLKKLME